MVVIHIKHKDESQFLFETTLNATVEDLVNSVTAIYNGRLKIDRICCEMEELAKHGTLYPPEVLGLTEEQVQELKLTDPWGEKCIPSGGFNFEKDPVGRRNGKRPRKEMQEVLQNAIGEAREMVSKKLVLRGTISHFSNNRYKFIDIEFRTPGGLKSIIFKICFTNFF